MMDSLLESAVILAGLWPEMLLGTGLILTGTVLGSIAGGYRTLTPTRAVTWWLTRVILPLLRTSHWTKRALTIFVNNTAMLALVVASGFRTEIAAAVIAITGVNLGIALRVLSTAPDHLVVPDADPGPHAGWQVKLGVGLNLLEPPAIIGAMGLSLGQETLGATDSHVWPIFGLWLVPLLLIAACGEATWLGAVSATRAQPDEVRGETYDPASDARGVNIDTPERPVAHPEERDRPQT